MDVGNLIGGLNSITVVLQWIVANGGTIAAVVAFVAAFFAKSPAVQQNEALRKGIEDVERANKKYLKEYGKDIPDLIRSEMAYNQARKWLEEKCPIWMRPFLNFYIDHNFSYEQIKGKMDDMIKESSKDAESLKAQVVA